jgi:hypothetical protein
MPQWLKKLLVNQYDSNKTDGYYSGFCSSQRDKILLNGNILSNDIYFSTYPMTSYNNDNLLLRTIKAKIIAKCLVAAILIIAL